jgi:hypothetical protein
MMLSDQKRVQAQPLKQQILMQILSILPEVPMVANKLTNKSIRVATLRLSLMSL